MFNAREDDNDTITSPAPAVTHTPFRSHQEHNTMGEDAYLRSPESISDVSGDAISERTTSTAHLTGAATGGTNQRRAFNSSSDNVQPGVGEKEGAMKMKAGMPIGFLAALGTPYAKKPIYRSRKCKILCPILGGITAAVTIIITLFPVLRAVAVHTLSTSVLAVSGSNITSPTNSSFGLTLEGQARKVGIFPAQLYFLEPVRVYWVAPENLTEELFLGQFPLARIGVAAGHGRIKQQTLFNITNEPAFARFTEFLITQKEFTWRLKSNNVQAKAFSFIGVNGLTFVKDLTLPGMANMTDISISDFQLPGDDPEGGISLSVSTKLTNPSAFGVEIGTLNVGLYYQGIYLGPARTTVPFNLTSGVNTINLVGRMISYADNTTALNALSTVFSNYLNGLPSQVEARGQSATLANGEVVDWLSRGIKALVLQVPLTSPTGRISPITGITIKELSLGFDAANPYAPSTNSSKVSATFGLPFGFSLSIVQLSNAFTIVSNQNAVTSLSAPLALSKSVILTRNAGYTTGALELELPLSRLVTPPSFTDHLIFDQFNYDFTTTTGANFILIGNTSVVTNTPIGQVLLTNIGFTVPAGLIGLNGLSTYPTEILTVDVIGGTKEAVMLAINVGITNPSNLDLTVGDVTFQLFRGNSFLGTTLLPELHLRPGYQEKATTGLLYGNANPVASQTLSGFAQGLDADLTISGFNGSSKTTSLTQAFMAIHLNATLKGLTSKLINYANLTVLPSTGVADSIAASTVSLQNPFTSPLQISNIQSNISAYGLFVGSIVQAVDFPAAGRAASDSPNLNFNLNLFPPDIFSLLRRLAIESGQSPEPLDGIVALGGLSYVPTADTSAGTIRKRSIPDYLIDADQSFADGLVSPSKYGGNPGSEMFEHMVSPEAQVVVEEKAVSDREAMENEIYGDNSTALTISPLAKRSLVKRGLYTGFNLPAYVQTAFSALTVTVDLVSVLNIGEFQTNLAYSQSGVPAYTDSSLTMLLPILARPIVQKIVDGSILGVNTVLISNPTNTAFTTGLTGAITNAGPFDAIIAFADGLTVAWNGAPLGQISMPNVALVADQGAQLDISAAFNVLSLSHLTEFTSYLLTEPSFTWQIYGQNLSVAALGITVGGISISKNVVLDGMNGFRGGVVVNSFDLPSNDPAGGVSLSLQTTLTNPSSVGVALSQIGFQNSFGATNIGPAGSTAPFNLLPKSTISLALAGRLIPQTTPTGLQDVSTIFNGFINGVPSDLIVKGDYAGPSDVTWLNEGIKRLSIAVVLPAAQNLQVINSISLNQLSLAFTPENPFAPSFSTSNTVAVFQLPFAFPVDIVAAKTSIIAGNGGVGIAKRAESDFGVLNVPLLPTVTDVQARTLLLTFQNVPFQSINNGGFSNFLTATTDSTSVNMILSGSTDTAVSTAIGMLNLQDVRFNVVSPLLGLQGLNARPAVVSNLDVFRGFPSFLQINADAALFNPSNITISTGDVQFLLTFGGQTIGAALITGLTLVPGVNIVPTQVRYQPDAIGSASQMQGQMLLQNFVQGVPSTTQINGFEGTTPITSLQPALSTIKLVAVIPPINQNLITQASLSFPLDIAQTKIANANFKLANPFTAAVNLLGVTADASYQGIFLGRIQVLSLNPPISAPGRSTITSPTLPLALNADPKTLARFLIAAASAQGVDLGPLGPQLQYLLSLSSTDSNVTSRVNQQPETCAPTGSTNAVNNIILASVQNLVSNLTIASDVKLDEYATPLDFTQFNVPTVLDRSVLYLTGILGPVLVSRIVDESTLAFTRGFITEVTDRGFTATLSGALLNAGPFDALIEFPNGVEVFWQGFHIADIALPPICSAGGSGVPNLSTTGVLTIFDQTEFTRFAAFILANPSFEWTITTNTLRVTALGTIFDNVLISKKVSFQAFNGLPGVAIANPNFPGDAGDRIILVTDSLIPSPSNLGILLGNVRFTAAFQGQEVGPVAGTGLNLAPLATTAITLNGFINKRTSQASTDSLGVLFTQFLAGQDSILQVTGVDVVSPAQPNSPVVWLSSAFRTLTLNVVLPGKKFDIISSIALRDLQVQITEQSQAYMPIVSNNVTSVVYKNPFGFSLTALKAGGAFFIDYQGSDAALLSLPLADVVSAETSTGQDAALVLNFKNQRLVSQNTGGFNNFFAAVTNTANVPFRLHGVTNVLARTVVGDVQINGIPFSVNTAFPGINSFGGRALVPGIPDVAGGNPEFILIKLFVVLDNPAPLILLSNLVSFGVIYRGVNVGRAFVNPLDLFPGSNTFASDFHYMPANPADPIAQDILAQYLETTGPIPITVQGDAGSSPYGSLQQGLSAITLPTSFPGQGLPIVKQLFVTLDAQTAICANSATVRAVLINHLNTFISVFTLKGSASQNGIVYSTFDSQFESTPIFAPAGGAAGAESAPSVPIPALLVRGPLGSLPLLGGSTLDIDIVSRASVGGYIVPGLSYQQKNVPYTIDYSVAGVGIQPIPSAIVTLLGAATSQASGFNALLGMFNTPSGAALCAAFTNGNTNAPISLPIPSAVQSVIGQITSQLTIPSQLASVITQVGGVLSSVLAGGSALPLSALPTSIPTALASGIAQVVGAIPTAAPRSSGASSGSPLSGLGLKRRSHSEELPHFPGYTISSLKALLKSAGLQFNEEQLRAAGY